MPNNSHLLPKLTDMAENPDVLKAKQRFSIIGNSPALLNAIGRAVKVAPIDLSVLVTGQSGTGKEFFPKIIHNFGARKHKKYIAVNCGAIPEGTIDSELFGHEKGSFTGAISDRKGYFEEADGGTIFLDEVAELPLTTQARLLRVLETGEYLRVGSSQIRKTNIRIVAATNVDLNKAVKEKRFREDLYYRLSTIVINVPDLQDRGDDILLLARKFASDFAEKYMTAPISFSSEARHALEVYNWPGNVRQLKNIVEQLALFHAGEEISRQTLLEALPSSIAPTSTPKRSAPAYESEREMLWQVVWNLQNEVQLLRRRLDEISGTKSDSSAPFPPLLHLPGGPGAPTANADSPFTQYEEQTDADEEPRSLEDSERATIVRALKASNGNRRQAAEALGISPRTLYRKLNDLDIDI